MSRPAPRHHTTARPPVRRSSRAAAVPLAAAARTMAASGSGVSLAATPLDRCPDCARPADGRWCATCGRKVDGLPSGLAGRVDRYLRRLTAFEVATRGHGANCITRETGGWARPAHDPGNLRQTCPCCGRDEYRGSFCTGCGIPTGAND